MDVNMECTNVVIRKEAEWTVVDINDRVDSFNHNSFKRKLDHVLESHADSVAFNLEPTQFLSLPSIKAMGEIAKAVRQNGGRAVLLAPSEKLKRQIDIYASLDDLEVVRDPGMLFKNSPVRHLDFK